VKLQLALDAPEHFALVPRLVQYFDIIEVGTPVLKRFGLSAISTALELGGGKPVLADSKTVDGGGLEAEMLFRAGASMMTVLASAGLATRERALAVAGEHGGDVIFDTILGPSLSAVDLPDQAPGATGRWLGLHSSFDSRGAASAADARALEQDNIGRVAQQHRRGYAVALMGGINPGNFAAVVEAGPEIAVIGAAVTAAADPEGVAKWLRDQISSTRG
jgi:3-hexulose-6-phosphate synthase